MVSWILSLLLVTLLPINQAYALCREGTSSSCTVNGKRGTRECVGGHFTPCLVLEPGTPPTTGTLLPKYFVLTVVYAPPGTEGGKSSSVTYGSGSSTGTTTSSSHSFAQNYAVSVSGGGGFLGKVNVGASFAYGKSTTRSDSVDVKKSETSTISDSGPGKDGVDHDHDLIYLWLNPKINLTLTSNSASWSFSGTDVAKIQYVYVGWLKDPSTMPKGVSDALTRNGITPQDYPDILARDPFTSCRQPPAHRSRTARRAHGPLGGGIVVCEPPPVDPRRYQTLHTTFPYEPPFSASDPVPTYSFQLTEATTSTSNSQSQDQYKVGLTMSAGGSFLGLAKTSLKSESSWTWTNTSSQASSTGSSQSASVTIGGPSFGYTGPTEMEVYYDTIYKTFLFRPLAAQSPTLSGRLLSATNKPVAFKEVTAVVNGVTYRTFTNARGTYRFFAPMIGPVHLKAGTLRRTLSQVSPGEHLDLHLRSIESPIPRLQERSR